MKTPAPLFRLRYLFLGCLALLAVIVRADQNLAGNVTVTGGAATGNLNVTGTIDSDSNTLTFGTQGANYGAALLYQDNTVDTFTFSANRNPASWLWQHNTSIPAMRLSNVHDLILYQADGSTAGITLQAASSSLKLGSIAALTGDSSGLLTTSGGLTVAGNITNTNGSFMGGAAGLTLNAGGTNQNITLSSSGTGDLVFNTNGLERARIKSSGNVGIGTTSPASVLEVGQSGTASNYGSVGLYQPSLSSGNDITFKTGVSSTLAMNFGYEASSVASNAFGWMGLAGDPVGLGLVVRKGGNVGIGTTIPTSPLTVSSDTSIVLGEFISYNSSGFGIVAARRARGSAAAPAATQSGDLLGAFMASGRNSAGWNTGNAGFQLVASENHTTTGQGNTIQFFTTSNGTTSANVKMVIGDNGNVGIGATAPGTKLEIKGANVSGRGLLYVNGDDHGFIVTNSPATGVTGIAFAKNGTANWSTGMAASDASYYVAEGASVGSNQRLAIAPGGNVGIGTTPPVQPLEVYKAGNAIIAVHQPNTAAPGKYAQVTLTHGPTYFGANDKSWQMVSNGLASGEADLTFQYWNGTGYATNATITNSGKVGIGTTSPGWAGSLLQVQTDQNATTRMLVKNDNSGTSSATEFVVNAYGNSWAMGMGSIANNSNAFYIGKDVAGGTPAAKYLSITTSGNVGIGTTTPSHKLSVAGTIRAYEVIVDNTWADYVFDDSYRLAPLSEVEQHIKAEKHLPGIPSAAEVAAHGVSMGDMQAKLLSKVEELTLHLIAQEKEIASLREQVAAMNRATGRSAP